MKIDYWFHNLEKNKLRDIKWYTLDEYDLFNRDWEKWCFIKQRIGK